MMPEREIESEIRVALKHLIDNRDIKLGSFTFDVQPSNQYVGVVLNYTNLRARANRSVTLIITN